MPIILLSSIHISLSYTCHNYDRCPKDGNIDFGNLILEPATDTSSSSTGGGGVIGSPLPMGSYARWSR